MVAGAREGTPADAVLGRTPRLVVEPATVEEAAEALRACARDRLRVVFVGGGTDLGLGLPPEGVDVVLRTGRLTRVVEHLPSDQIAVVEAGLTVSGLQGRLAPHRQRLALDPPLPSLATVGGVVAANASGPLRHRFGTARDLVVGMSFVRADGAVAKGGGKVVKNVAGFDVPRLLVGSLGTLALVTTVTLRLHPLPETEETVDLSPLRAAQVREVVAAARTAQLEASAWVALSAEGGTRWRVAVRLEGFAPGVAEGRAKLLALAARLGVAATPLASPAARALWDEHDEARSRGAVRARLTAQPARLPDLLEQGAGLAASLQDGHAVAYPSAGVAFVGGDPTEPATAAAEALSAARAALVPQGGTLVLVAAPPAVRALVDPWGPPPTSLGVMRRVKEQLDPERLLAPGRLLGGI